MVASEEVVVLSTSTTSIGTSTKAGGSALTIPPTFNFLAGSRVGFAGCTEDPAFGGNFAESG